eukprot:PITA_06352
MSPTRSGYKALGLELVEPLQDQPRKSRRPPMADEKKDEGAGDSIKILLEEALERQRNVMMDSFAQILQRLPTGDASASNSYSGNATPFNVQVNFEIPMFEGQIDADAVEKWINFLEGYFSVHEFSSRENIVFTLLKAAPHVKHWWETYCEQRDERRDGVLEHLLARHSIPIRCHNRAKVQTEEARLWICKSEDQRTKPRRVTQDNPSKPQEKNNTTKPKKHTRKWCEFHKSPTHNTSECRTKQSLVAELKASESDACSDPDPEPDKGKGKGKQIIDADPSTIVATAKIQKNEPENPEEGERLFHSQMSVKGSPLQFIVDSGSQENLVSAEVVKRLGLLTTPHPQPYNVGWLHEGRDLKVRRNVAFPIASSP